MRDHGGDLDAAMARFGGGPGDWIDLSTGINPRPWPLRVIPPRAFTALPTRSEMAALSAVAARAFGTAAPVAVLAGAQAAIQTVPMLLPPGRARVLSPTYNEHAASLRAAAWQVEEVARPEDLAGADLAVVVNPNNPDGRRLEPGLLLALARDVGLLVVDESFADPHRGLSLAPRLDGGQEGILVLRSFGKFWGLAGLRLGFALGGAGRIAALREAAGPWPVAGPAIAAAMAALADEAWKEATIARLREDAARLDRLAAAAGWRLAGGTALFRLYDAGDAAAAQEQLARHRIWSRRFPHTPAWLRLGLPGDTAAWARLEVALAAG